MAVLSLGEACTARTRAEPTAKALLGFFEIAEEKTHPGMIHPGRTQFSQR
jgi:hypothetical protein